MTLSRLLGINRSLVHFEALRSLELAERTGMVRGEPTEGQELIDVLEKVLTRCVELEIRYAPILLQRKKALERSSWRPRHAPRTDPPTAPASAPAGPVASAAPVAAAGDFAQDAAPTSFRHFTR